jgi:peptide/nickel transport system substrate-binding protein
MTRLSIGTLRRSLALAVGCLVCFAWLACAEPPAARTEAAGGPGAAARPGGTLIVATHQDIAGINDLVSNDVSFSDEVIGQMFLDLFDEQDDFTEHPPTFAPRLAESYEFSEDRLALTVRLRPGVRWSDGVPVTARDVRWTWQAQTHPGVGWTYAHSKDHIRDVEVVDDSTVRFHFDHAYATQLQHANEGFILPRHVWSELPFDEWPEGEPWFQQRLVVNGPFLLDSWKPQEEIVLVRNPDYYEPELPRLDRIVFRIIPDRVNHVTQLLRGEVDFVPRVETEDVGRIEGADGVVLYPYWHRQYTYLGWNLARPLFAEAEVRQALAMAIDRQTIIDTLRAGYARIATSPILSSVWAYADLEPWPYDPRVASQRLADAGWTPGPDGILARDGQRFSFTILTNTSRSWRDTLTMVQEQLKLVGIEVAIQQMEMNTLVERMHAHDFDAYIGSFGIDTALDLTYAFHSDSIADSYNFGSYSNPRVDELIEQANRQIDPRDAGPMLVEIQQILHREQPFAFLWEPQRISAMRDSLRDADPNPVSTFQNLRRWWIEG